jgi:hypothetical protein
LKKILFITILLSLFVGCGSSKNDSTSEEKNQNLKDNSLSVKRVDKDMRVLTIYIHGFSKSGVDKVGVYGDDNYDKVIDKLIEFSDFATTKNYTKDSKNIIAITPYYGNQPPSYYDSKDIADVESKKGIPRYALIMAKFAKHMMKKTNSKKLNIVSASMGSLIARYMIEKDLESLSSNKKISRWLSLEGVIHGNIAASNDYLLRLANSFEKLSSDVEYMRYDWIEKNLNPTNQNYNGISIAFESSTDDSLNHKAITLFEKVPNDGVQAVKDTYFNSPSYPKTYFHQTHVSLDDSPAAWAFATTFLISSKRVRVTLKEVTIKNLHEDPIDLKLKKVSILPAEIVFASKTYSPLASNRWGFEGAIDERVYEGHTLKVFEFDNAFEKKEINYTIFDSVILDDESELKVEITPYEIDRDFLYGVNELTGHGDSEKLSPSSILLPLKNGIYDIESSEWSGKLEVEIF